MREFWSGLVTRKSWERLVALSRKYKFVLIGGWAAYLWTGMHKSKDIDILVGYGELNALKAEFAVEKNERLRKYEIKMGEFDVDIYLPGYSRLSFPLEHLEEYTENVQGIRVPCPEALMVLKQGAETERRGSVKGKKDLIDILTLLAHSGFSLRKYREILKRFSLEKFEKELEGEILLFSPRDVEYVGMDLNGFAKWKRKFIDEIKGRA